MLLRPCCPRPIIIIIIILIIIINEFRLTWRKVVKLQGHVTEKKRSRGVSWAQRMPEEFRLQALRQEQGREFQNQDQDHGYLEDQDQHCKHICKWATLTYKILFGHVDLDVNLFEFCSTLWTRGHQHKLYKHHTNHCVRSSFFCHVTPRSKSRAEYLRLNVWAVEQ